MNKLETEKDYKKWCKKIAEARSASELIAHFREHVWAHYDRHSRDGKESLDMWLLGAINFLDIFKEKFPHLTVENLLFKLCRHHKKNPGRAEPDFDIEKFMEEYTGFAKTFTKTKNELI